MRPRDTPGPHRVNNRRRTPQTARNPLNEPTPARQHPLRARQPVQEPNETQGHRAVLIKMVDESAPLTGSSWPARRTSGSAPIRRQAISSGAIRRSWRSTEGSWRSSTSRRTPLTGHWSSRRTGSTGSRSHRLRRPMLMASDWSHRRNPAGLLPLRWAAPRLGHGRQPGGVPAREARSGRRAPASRPRRP